MWFLLPLILWPLVEIGLFVTLGAWLGLWPTLAWVVGTAILGMYVIRCQGERAQVAMRQGFVAFSEPLSPMAQGALTVAAGVLLILPGFLTDALGLLLLMPAVRSLLVAGLARRVVVAHPTRRHPDHRPDVIDGEFIDLDAENLPPRTGKSGWARNEPGH